MFDYRRANDVNVNLGATEKGKPIESWGRNATGPQEIFGQRGCQESY